MSAILKMPDELLLDTTDYLGDADLHTLRLVCKRLENVTFDRFASGSYMDIIISNCQVESLERRLEVVLRGSGSLCSRVRKLSKTFSVIGFISRSIDLKEKLSDSGLHRFTDILNLLPSLEKMHLSGLVTGGDREESIARTLSQAFNTTVLSELHIDKSVLSSVTLRNVLGAIPAGTSLQLHGCTSTDGWSPCFVAIAKSAIKKFTFSGLVVYNRSGPSHRLFSLCGEPEEKRAGDRRYARQMKNFRTTAGFEQYLLHPGNISYITGRTAIKAAIKSILSHHMSSAEVDKLVLA